MDRTAQPARRAFLIRVSGVAGSGAVATLLPVSLLQAGEACALPAAPAPGVAVQPDRCGDWTLDDVFTAYPPYTFDIRGVAQHVVPEAAIAPVDAMWGV